LNGTECPFLRLNLAENVNFNSAAEAFSQVGPQVADKNCQDGPENVFPVE
jgi:hypothetical protein